MGFFNISTVYVLLSLLLNCKMKKNIRLNFLLLLFINSTSSFAQKTISEGILSYTILIEHTDKIKGNIDSATSIVYLKGDLSRTDLIDALGSETAIVDAKTGNAVILKQYNGQKLMVSLTRENWNDKYSRYDGMVFQPTTETKEIAGYSCKKTIAQLKNGASFSVYYVPGISVFNKEYDPIFKRLPGLPVQYRFIDGKLAFDYTLSAFNFDLVPAAKFEIPKSGYRVIPYDAK